MAFDLRTPTTNSNSSRQAMRYPTRCTKSHGLLVILPSVAVLLLLLLLTATTTPATANNAITEDSATRVGGHGPISSSSSWLSSLKISATGGERSGEWSWSAYEAQKSNLARQPDDHRQQLATAEALLKWVRCTTNGNFPRAGKGCVGDGDSPSSRKIWRKHAPEALRLLKLAASYAQNTGNGYDVAKYHFLHAEASTYLSSAKGILRAALQADAVTFKRNVKPLIADYPEYQGGVGHTFIGAFHLAAPWPVHDLSKAQFHFDAALTIDPRCRRNHYCRGLVALAKGDTAKAQSSFRQAVRCKSTSPEEEDVADFFLRESRGALKALETRAQAEKAAVE